ncbi:amidohydrolase [Paenibacillus sp. MMS20-IR301]|uniref:amidohydrolase n=1 Tax=Paenibacillus sp. MMS20-IR301 TaxID=2895946 RepID=UPI0028EB2FAC|nr:amidohydrolase [Paenibacillus sp. MMS20-IR301]WNS43953.1 amidohydrolase [Paenibacillus sp. MMS20-IR301]
MAYPEQIYINGIVLTFDQEGTTAEAIAVRGERIAAVGSTAELLELAGPETAVIDLQGKTVLPGFYEAHGHFPLSGILEVQSAALWSPPRGTITSIAGLLAALKEKAAAIPAGGWVTGFGYDPSKLAEKRHPSRYELDQAFPEHPVWLSHNSAHMGVANSRALAIAGITQDSPAPAIGVIQRDPDGEPTGLIQENGALIEAYIPPLSAEQHAEGIRLANAEYLSQGITTAIIAVGIDPEPLVAARSRGLLELRLINIPLFHPEQAPLKDAYDYGSVKSQGAKLFQDGSIQGYTGWLTNPYHTPFSEDDPLYRGFPMLEREELAEAVLAAHSAGRQVVIHANGDAAIDDVLYAIGEAQRQLPRPDARHRIEHAQSVREDQLDRIKELGITPSFFNDHVYYFGDNHRDIYLGEDRARRISPLRSAVDRGIRFSLHNDTPITPPSPLHLVSVAVNRLTSSGRELGPEYRITPYQALRAVTIDAAWQAFEEQDKGSIEPGKLADLVVLADNPLTADPLELHKIPVLRTIIGGRQVYVQAESAIASQQ